LKFDLKIYEYHGNAVNIHGLCPADEEDLLEYVRLYEEDGFKCEQIRDDLFRCRNSEGVLVEIVIDKGISYE